MQNYIGKMIIRTAFMSKKNPECPLYNPLNCKEYYNPKLCAFVRRDKTCRKKKKPKPSDTSDENKNGEASVETS